MALAPIFRVRPVLPPKTRTFRSRSWAARRLTRAVSPVTASPSMKMRRPGHRVRRLEVDLVQPPALVVVGVVGQGRRGQGHQGQGQQSGGHRQEPAAPGPAPHLMRGLPALGILLGRLAAVGALRPLGPALPEPAMGPEGRTPLLPRRLHRLAHAGCGFLGQQPQRVRPGLHRQRGLAPGHFQRDPA